MSGTLGILTDPDVQVPMRDGVRMAAHVFRPNVDGRFDIKALIEKEKGEKTSSAQKLNL